MSVPTKKWWYLVLGWLRILFTSIVLLNIQFYHYSITSVTGKLGRAGTGLDQLFSLFDSLDSWIDHTGDTAKSSYLPATMATIQIEKFNYELYKRIPWALLLVKKFFHQWGSDSSH